MIVVLDASAALGIVLKKEKSGGYTESLADARAVIAPELCISEIANAAWKYYKYQRFTRAEAVSLAEDGIALVDQYIPVEGMWKEALRESITYDHPVHDVLYIICARRNDGVLFTYDKRLRQLCKEAGVEYY